MNRQPSETTEGFTNCGVVLVAKTRGKVFARNRKARHDYSIEETVEAGLVLTGTEVKSVREGSASLRDSYAMIENGEAWLFNSHISPYEQGNQFNHEPRRPRKLLLHRREIDYLYSQVRERGYTLVPLKLYESNGFIKVELAVAKGKRQYDKRRDIKERDAERRMRQAVRRRR